MVKLKASKVYTGREAGMFAADSDSVQDAQS